MKRGSVDTTYKNLAKLKKFFGFSKFSLYLGLVRSGKRPKIIFPILYIFFKNRLFINKTVVADGDDRNILNPSSNGNCYFLGRGCFFMKIIKKQGYEKI